MASIIGSVLSNVLGSVSFSAKNELTGLKCLATLKVKDVEIDSSSANTNNPIVADQKSESGTYVSLLSSDINTLKIIQPSRMRIAGFCSSTSSIENVTDLFLNEQTTIQITTKGITAKHMAVISVEIEQIPEMISASKVTIELEQAYTESELKKFNPAQSSDSQTYGVSMQTPPTFAKSVSDLYNKVSNLVKVI